MAAAAGGRGLACIGWALNHIRLQGTILFVSFDTLAHASQDAVMKLLRPLAFSGLLAPASLGCLGAPATGLAAKGSAVVPQTATAPAKGPLRIDPDNPRYFSDGHGQIVFLTGSHTWGNLQDYAYSDGTSPAPMNFDRYLAFLKQHSHNFFRLWAWETAMNRNAKQSTIRYEPMAYERPGPGVALDGKPKFDLRRFNERYFARLRARVAAARDAGIYASVMLFNGFSVEGKGNVGGDPWPGHPFNPANNINGVDGVAGTNTHTLSLPGVTALQEAYVRKVIDTVNDLDNVLYEISNEDSGSSADIAWQVHMIRFIHNTEAARPKQHPVGMTVPWPSEGDAVLYNSPADWISPAAKAPKNDGRKVILNDTDHSYFWIGLRADGIAAQRAWVWENFTQGNQCLFMDPYLDPSHDPGRNHPSGDTPDPYWDPLRDALGQTARFAGRMDLRAARPHEELASSSFCLASLGQQYLVYLPIGGEVTLDLTAASGTLNVEWMRPSDRTRRPIEHCAGGRRTMLKAPFAPGEDAVVYVWRP